MRRIFRRVLLVAPWLTNDVNNMRGYTVGLNEFVQFNDLSVRRDAASNNIEVNTLADLTRREYRYGRGGGSSFPFAFEYGRLSDDHKYLVLNDALAFDVLVYDPGAPLFNVAGVVVQPGDPSWDNAATVPANAVGFGAYVDLGWDNGSPGNPNRPDYFPVAAAPLPLFQSEHRVGWHPMYGPDPTTAVPNPTPANPFRGGGPSVYDTWTWHYENDGVDQYGDGIDTNADGVLDRFVDMARNGVDDDIPAGTGYYAAAMPYANGVDDIGERETSPPYPVPLRGVKVILRTYERDARQVREVSVTNSFVP
jgi:hypothetical protein